MERLCSNCDLISKATIVLVKHQRMINDYDEEFWLKFPPALYGKCKCKILEWQDATLSERYKYRLHFFDIKVMACPYWKNEEMEEEWRIEGKGW